MRSRISIILAIVTVLTGLGLYWYFTNYERVEREVNSGYSGEALLNNYLAAIRFLDKTGHQVDYKSSLLSMGDLPPPTDVLVIPTRRFDIGPERVDSLIDWVKSGGHLVIRAFKYKSDTNRTDYLLDELGIETVTDNDKPKHNAEEMEDTIANLLGNDNEKEKNIDNKKQKNTLMAKVTENGEAKEIRMSKLFYLKNDSEEYPAIWSVTDGTGDTIIELEVGKGRVTVLNTLRMFTNKQIDKYDHASFLWHLVNPGKTHPKIWLILTDDMPPLYKLLYKHAKYAVISFIILILFWILYAAPRFGARLPASSPSRRELTEHIQAAGNFLWQTQEQHALIQASKQAILDILGKTQPHWLQLKEPQLIDKLATHCKLPHNDVAKAFGIRHAIKELEFIKTMQTLSTIRNKL